MFRTVLLGAELTLFPNGQEWQQSQNADPLHGTNYQLWTLEGKYLTPPHGGSSTPPLLVIHCEPGKHHRLNGKFIDGHVSVNAVIDTRVSHEGHTYIPVELKLDDGKLQLKGWGTSTDRQAAFFSWIDLNNLLYGHEITHKPGKGDQIHKVILGINEYLAAEVVMQFDLPDSGQIAEACGAVYGK